MYHAAIRRTAAADPRPMSAVSTGCGVAGLLGLAAWILFARLHDPVMAGPYAALAALAGCALPMIGWSLLVDRVHRNPSTGLDWSHARRWSDTREITVAKLIGLWATWGLIALIYACGKFWWQGGFAFAMWCFQSAAPVLVALSIPYLLVLDRYAVEPRDGSYALGCWIMGTPGGRDHAAIAEHLRGWAVKAFFLAFMLAIVPSGFAEFVSVSGTQLMTNPVALAGWLVTGMFVVDVAFATVGYILTLRPLDAHIRSANPYAAGWTAALICYPPFLLMSNGGPLDYHETAGDWTRWLADWPVLLGATGALLVALTAVYAWSTVAFGMRFSNLTNRGIITHGPYAWSKHPAYLSKNVFWFVSTLPFLTTGGWFDAVRATLLMGVVAGVYYWRARTEERHLMADPDYRDYAAWMARHAPLPRLLRRLRGQKLISS